MDRLLDLRWLKQSGFDVYETDISSIDILINGVCITYETTCAISSGISKLTVSASHPETSGIVVLHIQELNERLIEFLAALHTLCREWEVDQNKDDIITIRSELFGDDD